MDSRLFDFNLPKDLIAQEPLEKRDESRLLVCTDLVFSEIKFKELLSKLNDRYFVILNNAKVIPVRVYGSRILSDGKIGPGIVEALLLEKLAENKWTAILNLSAKIKQGMRLVFKPDLTAEILSTHEEQIKNEGVVEIQFIDNPLNSVENWLELYGHIPLPPYIERSASKNDKANYQTVYAKELGSAAAPTAGFHFTTELIERLQAKGVEFGSITLNVGLGTFRPMKTENINDHRMHHETYEVTEEFKEKISRARSDGKIILAVGTTVVRALESWMLTDQGVGKHKTDIFIKPGFKFKVVDELITNFHLPRSTLFVLVCAFMGIENAKAAYMYAIENKFRFFSYGDALWLRTKNG